ncbi:tRNA epoxyqueuosine(34) reductase QueG [Sporolactobacillus sp. THM7-4]|nr:tRNA epoxyqueuosine(34) reductase QueG [Sporolactobacillus sp. THM7-4]
MTDFEKLKKRLIEYSKKIGVDKIGFTTSDPFTELKARLYQQQALGYQSGFEKKDIEKRTEPSLLMDGVQSIVSIALAYPKKMARHPENTKANRRGAFARVSWGRDYHVLLRDCLQKMGEFLAGELPGSKFKNMVDTGELSDRAVAERAGIGWSGKNTNVITKEFGSYVYLGEMLTNIPFPPDKPAADLCGDCTLCVDHCPTGALVQGGQLNSHKCIAFLTQIKQDIPEHYRKAVGNRVYGCDTCQQVCPYNRDVDSHLHEEMEPDPELARPLLKPLLSISNREFKEKFGELSGSWRGRKPIQRNAIIALGNYKDVTAAPEMLRLLREDPRPVIRRAAVWSLAKMWDRFEDNERRRICETLQKLLENEEDEKVREGIKHQLAASGNQLTLTVISQKKNIKRLGELNE